MAPFLVLSAGASQQVGEICAVRASAWDVPGEGDDVFMLLAESRVRSSESVAFSFAVVVL